MGANWSSDLATQLAEAKAGIICVTADNQHASWLNFEAGVLSRTVGKVMVCPYLIDIKPADLDGPLVQFQAAQATKSDTLELFKTLNKALGDHSLGNDTLDSAFDKWWSNIAEGLDEIHKAEPVPQGIKRSDREILEEVLSIARQFSKEWDRLTSPNAFTAMWNPQERRIASLLRQNAGGLTYAQQNSLSDWESLISEHPPDTQNENSQGDPSGPLSQLRAALERQTRAISGERSAGDQKSI